MVVLHVCVSVCLSTYFILFSLLSFYFSFVLYLWQYFGYFVKIFSKREVILSTNFISFILSTDGTLQIIMHFPGEEIAARDVKEPVQGRSHRSQDRNSASVVLSPALGFDNLSLH